MDTNNFKATPVTKLKLSQLALGCLVRANIKTVEQLRETDIGTIFEINGMTKNIFIEIANKVRANC